MPLNPEGVKCKLLDNTATSTELGIGLYSPLQRTSCETNSCPHPFPADQVLTPRPSRLPALGPDRLFRLHLSLLQMRFCCSTHLSLLPSSHTSSQCSLCQKRPPPVVRLQVPAPTSPTLPAPPRSRGGTMPSAPHQPRTALGALALQGTDVRFSASAPESPSSEVFLF